MESIKSVALKFGMIAEKGKDGGKDVYKYNTIGNINPDIDNSDIQALGTHIGKFVEEPLKEVQKTVVSIHKNA